MASLGFRLNNPLNIRYSKDNKWLGQIGVSRDFCEFSSQDYGFRAAMLLIERYIVVYRLRSARQIVSRFAPPSENKTECYIRFVEKWLCDLGYNVSDIEPYSEKFYQLVCAMAKFESNIFVSVSQLNDITLKFHLRS